MFNFFSGDGDTLFEHWLEEIRGVSSGEEAFKKVSKGSDDMVLAASEAEDPQDKPRDKCLNDIRCVCRVRRDVLVQIHLFLVDTCRDGAIF